MQDSTTEESLTTNVSPDKQALGTLEYNLRHAVEKRDERTTALCLTELFRHFVSLNIPMTRFTSFQLDHKTQLELCMAIGPFSNPLSLGMHQRLLALLLGIVVRQLGIAAPTMTSYVMEQWKLYERVLFHDPALALAWLLGIGATLCHCKKDASVAYTRHIFEDTPKMREWRKQLLANPNILKSFMQNADHATRASRMLSCDKQYFKPHVEKQKIGDFYGKQIGVLTHIGEHHLKKYQKVCITTPHPQYMYQEGSMQRINLLKLVDSIKQGIPENADPSALAVIQDVEDVMICLSGHVDNMYDRDAYDDLQVDFQIFLYLFQRILREESSVTLISASETIILSAPNQINEAYALQLCASRPENGRVHQVRGTTGRGADRAGSWD